MPNISATSPEVGGTVDSHNSPVTAPKSYFGNLGQGSGMVELAVSLLAISRGVVPPTLNYETPDPECPVNVVARDDVAPGDAFIKLSITPQGQASAVAVRRFS